MNPLHRATAAVSARRPVRRLVLALSLALAPGLAAAPAFAAEDFGTREEARALARALVSVIDREGLAAAAQAVVDPDGPFRHSRMGVNLFNGPTVIADNREPETVAMDYSQVADLTGALVWPIIHAAAQKEDDALLKWYHYDTQEEYDYRCYSMMAARDGGVVMVCR